MSHPIKFKDLLGKRIMRVEVTDSEVFLHTSSGFYNLYHEQDCCEDVYVEDVCGDIDDIVGIITEAEEVVSEDNIKDGDESGTWTFYKLGTQKGSVTIRFYGTSNGYYSERVNCVYVDNGYSTARGKMLSYLSKNASKGGVSMEHSKMLDHELLECYTKAVDNASRESQKHIDLSRIQKLDKGILLPYLIKTVAEEKVDIFLLKETDNGDGTNTHILEIVSKKEEA